MDKIGQAVKTVRKRYHLKARQVYFGLLSQPAYQRLESGIRELRPHVLEAILSRLGITCDYVEMLISNKDFEIYYAEEEYRRCLSASDCIKAEQIKEKFVKEYGFQDKVLKQKGYRMEAELAYQKKDDLWKVLEWYKEAFLCTVSFNALREEDMQLFSREEMKLSVKIAELYMEMGEMEKAEQHLWKMKSYMSIFPKKADKANEEAKLYYYLAKFLLERKSYREVLDYIEKAMSLLSKMKGFTIQGDLFFYRAKTLELLYQEKTEWIGKRNIALRDFVTAYYVYEFQGNKEKCNEILGHVKEKYGWQNI